MRHPWGWLLLCLLLVIPVLAQDDSGIPQAVVDVALDAAEAQRETRSENYRFQILGRTTSSALGCPLVQGETLPFEVTPYRVEVIYPDGIYVVHVSADARYVQLCDPKFGDAMTSPADPEALENACRLTPNAAVPVYVAPSETVPGVEAATAGEAVRVFGRSSDDEWYQIAAGQGAGWIAAESVTLSGDCDDLAATGFTVPNEGATCFVSSLGAFANVRSQPTTDAARVARIFENAQYQVTARNTAGDWFYIQPGWVAGTVIDAVGECVNLTVSDNLVGVGFTEDLPGELDESVSRALAEFACTADFAGYMEPRLQVGIANAQVEVGGLPNALRSFPSVDDTQSENIGTIQPGRTIDRVIAGPICNQGFVWWLVEFDGQTGWTAESNESSSDYFLEPLSGSLPPAADAGDDSAAQTDPTSADGLRPGANQEFVQTWRQGENPITQIIFNADGSRLYSVSSVPGFGDGVQGEVAVWGSDGSEIARLTATAEIVGIGLNDEDNTLFVADVSGSVRLYNTNPLEQTADYPGLFTSSPVSHRAEVAFFAGDRNLFAINECTDTGCATIQISVYDLDAGELLWTAEPNQQEITALAFSNDEANLQLAASSERGVQAWDAVSGTPRYTFDGSGLAIYDIAFNSDDTRLLAVGCSTCDTAGSIALLDAQTGALLGIAQGHTEAARLVAFAPDDATLASANSSRQIILRDAVSGDGLGVIDVPDVTITALTYDPVTALPVFGTSDGWIVTVRYTGGS